MLPEAGAGWAWPILGVPRPGWGRARSRAWTCAARGGAQADPAETRAQGEALNSSS